MICASKIAPQTGLNHSTLQIVGTYITERAGNLHKSVSVANSLAHA